MWIVSSHSEQQNGWSWSFIQIYLEISTEMLPLVICNFCADFFLKYCNNFEILCIYSWYRNGFFSYEFKRRRRNLQNKIPVTFHYVTLWFSTSTMVDSCEKGNEVKIEELKLPPPHPLFVQMPDVEYCLNSPPPWSRFFVSFFFFFIILIFKIVFEISDLRSNLKIFSPLFCSNSNFHGIPAFSVNPR